MVVGVCVCCVLCVSMPSRLSEDARRHLLYGQRSLHDSPLSIPAWQFPGCKARCLLEAAEADGGAAGGSHLCLAVPEEQQEQQEQEQPGPEQHERKVRAAATVV